MTSYRYKVGDLVMCVTDSYDTINPGEVGVVIKARSHLIWADFPSRSYHPMLPAEIEPYEEEIDVNSLL